MKKEKKDLKDFLDKQKQERDEMNKERERVIENSKIIEYVQKFQTEIKNSKKIQQFSPKTKNIFMLQYFTN